MNFSKRGVRIRLVKGAYNEPPDIAFARKRDVDRSYATLTEKLLASGIYHAIATHDERIIAGQERFARGRGIPPQSFEFQLLYGIRRQLAATADSARMAGTVVCSLRTGVVSLFHAPACGAACQSVFPDAQPFPGMKRQRRVEVTSDGLPQRDGK